MSLLEEFPKEPLPGKLQRSLPCGKSLQTLGLVPLSTPQPNPLKSLENGLVVPTLRGERWISLLILVKMAALQSTQKETGTSRFEEINTIRRCVHAVHHHVFAIVVKKTMGVSLPSRGLDYESKTKKQEVLLI